jgi:8-oxo-dGTP pyrophosphatase MutT (NUDIX family)
MADRIALMIRNLEGEILLGKKRADSPKKLAGCWHMPGEGLENGETDEQGIIRCVQEELGIDSNEILIGGYITTGITPTSKRTLKWYACTYLGDPNEINPSDDLEDVKWVNKNEVLEYCGENAYSLWPQEVINRLR